MPLLEPGRGDIPTFPFLFLYNHSLCLACFSAAYIKTDPSCLTDLMWSHGPSSALSLLLGFWRRADVLFCFPVHSVENQHMTIPKQELSLGVLESRKWISLANERITLVCRATQSCNRWLDNKDANAWQAGKRATQFSMRHADPHGCLGRDVKRMILRVGGKRGHITDSRCGLYSLIHRTDIFENFIFTPWNRKTVIGRFRGITEVPGMCGLLESKFAASDEGRYCARSERPEYVYHL